MTPRAPSFAWSLLAGLVISASCSSEDTSTTAAPVQKPSGCPDQCFEPGVLEGHADPFGAKSAKQARATRVKDAAQIIQAPDKRAAVNVGDFLLTNDKIAVYIEDKGLSDGYARQGGGILAIDKVGDDGKPLGLSRYGETLMAISKEMIEPDSVTVLRDGSDGGAAVVRVMGKLKDIEFLGSLKSLFPREYGFQAIYDYILEPGTERLKIRLGLKNESGEDADLKFDEMHGFFHSNRSRLVTKEFGYATPKGLVAWAGFESGPWGFVWRLPGRPIEYAVEISGFQYFTGKGLAVANGETKFFDYVEVIAGGPHLDGLLDAVRRVDGDTSFREVKGTVTDTSGAPVPGAFVHLLGDGDAYLSRTIADDQGNFVIHAPPSNTKLVASRQGYGKHEGAPLAPGDATAALKLPAGGKLHVVATQQDGGGPMPVRIQVIPSADPGPEPPAAWGESRESRGRLHQEFAISGEATLDVPPGDYRVIVSHGYEWDLLDKTVSVQPGQTLEVPAPLVHSVDTSGVMCADFHIHSFFSADSDDPVDFKVRGALADGLDIPVSSEHEWVVDFQPIIQKMGMTKWAFGVPSEELTTFTWGHFGVLPIRPRPERVNMGAIDWIGKEPPAFFKEVHAQDDKPLLIINHPSGGGFGAYFSSAGLKRDTGTGNPKLWSDEFEAIEVYNDSDHEKNRDASVADWFALLNVGKKVWAVGSSDSHHLRGSPVGYPRTCIQFGHDDPEKLTPEAVRDGVASGNSTISGGLYLTVKGPGGEAPGQTVKGDEITFDVTVRAPAWINAESLEVIVNGKTVETTPLALVEGSPGKRFQNQITVKRDPASPRNWVVFHAKGTGDLSPLHPGRNPFAVSNPIFLE